MLGLVVVALAVASGFGARTARPSPNLLFGFTDNAPLTAGTRATNPALAAGAQGFAFFLIWQPGKALLTPSETAGLVRAITAAHGARIVLVVRPLGGSPPLTTSMREQFCTYARNAVNKFPIVNDVVIGNEANANYFWRPQYNFDGSSAAPAAYEALLARCYDVLHAFRPAINVAAPGTSPHGNDNPNASSNVSHSPTRFIRRLAEAYRASGRTERIFDTVVHHPYGDTNDERPYLMHPTPFFMGQGDWNKLVATYREAFAGTAQAVPGRCLPPGPCVPIWYLEAGFQTWPLPAAFLYYGNENVITIPSTSPGEPASPSPLATSPAPDQATQLRYALRLAYCQPYVEAVFNFLIRDDRDLLGYQSGILWANWTPKESYGPLATVVGEVRAHKVSCQAPSAPTSLTAELLDAPSRIKLRWGASSSAIGVSGYRVYRNGRALDATNGLSDVDNDIAGGHTYSYVVRGYDAAGQTGSASAARVVSTPTSIRSGRGGGGGGGGGGGSGGAGGGSSTVRGKNSCRPVSVRSKGRQRVFGVRIVHGQVSCVAARRAIRVFMVRHRSPKPWRCVRSKGRARWAATCTRSPRKQARVVVRAFRTR
jgi:hypothetical protein